MSWAGPAQDYLKRLGSAEYRLQKAQHKGKFRYCPSEYHRTLVQLLGEGKEEEFKYLKLLNGRDSALGF